MRVRHTAVAGTFYPAHADQLRHDIDHLLSCADTTAPIQGHLKALIVPHAGYIYSGPIAASAYHLLHLWQKSHQPFTRVVLLGPSHRVALSGVALPDCDAFATPLGIVRLDTKSINDLNVFSFVNLAPEAHALEHSLEVQIPFLQSVLDEFVLIPLVVGKIDPQQVAQLLEPFWQDDNTLIVISSDLSHFLTYTQAQRRDSDTSRLIESHYYQLHGEQACGCYPLNGLLKLVGDRDLNVITLDQRNSGDTAGDKNRVVGYGAYAVFEARTVQS